MTGRFFDASAFAKRYRDEIGTSHIDAMLSGHPAKNAISALRVTEMHSILARLVRDGDITPADFGMVRKRFLADIATGLWHVLPVTQSHFHLAQSMLASHGPKRSLRTLDAIQIAVAVSNAEMTQAAFVCADSKLCNAAAMQGLNVINPELPHLLSAVLR